MKKRIVVSLVVGFVLAACPEVYALAIDDNHEKKVLLSKRVKFNEFLKKWRLELNDKQISDLTNLSNIKDITKVECLDLNNNEISEIKETDFEKCINLECLYLRNNNIKVVTAGLFTCLKKLEYLDISRNPIKSIEPGALACLADILKELSIDKKLLDDQEVFDQLKKELPNTDICKCWPKNSSTSLDGWILQKSLELEKNLRIPDLVIAPDLRLDNNQIPDRWKVEFKETKE